MRSRPRRGSTHPALDRASACPREAHPCSKAQRVRRAVDLALPERNRIGAERGSRRQVGGGPDETYEMSTRFSVPADTDVDHHEAEPFALQVTSASVATKRLSVVRHEVTQSCSNAAQCTNAGAAHSSAEAKKQRAAAEPGRSLDIRSKRATLACRRGRVRHGHLPPQGDEVPTGRIGRRSTSLRAWQGSLSAATPPSPTWEELRNLREVPNERPQQRASREELESQTAATSRASDSTESGAPEACSTRRSQRTERPGANSFCTRTAPASGRSTSPP
jgi:hypothetical protein